MAVSQANDFDQVSISFLDWLLTTGASISNKIGLRDLRSQNAGRGVVAEQDIAEDEELFRIPRSSILSAETSEIPTAYLRDLSDPWLSLILAMVFEHQQNGKSKWQAYLNILPSSFDTPMFWSAAELGLLKGSAVANKIGRDSADRMFTEQLLPNIRAHAEDFNASDLNDQDLLSLCHRMGSTIMAYAFDLEKTSAEPSQSEEDGWEEDTDHGEGSAKGMVPLADMLNADADRNNARLFYGDDHVVMKSIKPVKAGEEVFNDYGPLPRGDVLRRYGYVTDSYAKYDVVEVSPDLIQQRAADLARLSSPDAEERLQYADEQGILDTAYDISRAGGEDGAFPEELCVLLNLLCLPAPDFAKLKAKDKLPKADLSREARRLLYSILVYRYAMYHPTADLEANRTGEAARHHMALAVIQGEKDVLQEAANSLTATSGSGKRKAETLEEDARNLRPSKTKPGHSGM